jgi:hypothetical protein
LAYAGSAPARERELRRAAWLVASAPDLRQPVMALSLGGLRRRIEIATLPDEVRVVLQLDGLAERERHRRRAQAPAVDSRTNKNPG